MTTPSAFGLEQGVLPTHAKVAKVSKQQLNDFNPNQPTQQQQW
jgi:hypothetical protein